MRSAGYILFFLFVLNTSAQEVIIFPGENSSVKNLWKKSTTRKALTANDTLSLPFFDDFSRNTIFPDSSLWSDRQAFINFTYGVDPVSVGVATLDAIDETGSIYPQASQLPFEADHLTSKPIDLAFQPTDGIFFSFYYQPQGIADPPEEGDSLVLLFYAPLQQRWDTVWHHHGETLTPFREVMIPVTDTAFLHKGFRFRFVNFASLTRNNFDPGAVTNCDHWNIDYVYLNTGRFAADTLPRDVAFVRPIPSLLKTYERMPWKHFRKTFLTEMGSTFPIAYRNNDSIIRNVTREFRIRDLSTGQLSHSFSGGASNAPADSLILYNAPLIYTFNTSGVDSAIFELKSYLITDDFDPKINDTLTRLQIFRDEFAYDDGTAEAGYGLNGNGMENAALAYRFHSYLPDTLKAVRIWFNRSKDDANLVPFNLVIWNDSSGVPGIALYRQVDVIPVFEDNRNGFITFPLDTTLVIDGDFYVGWQQSSITFLNVGFDLNLDRHQYARIRTSGSWKESTISGTIMIRPVFGKNEIMQTGTAIHNNTGWSVYPNPVTSTLYVTRPGFSDTDKQEVISIYTMTGRIVSRIPLTGSRINVSSLKQGIYLLVIDRNGRRIFHTKIIKQ